LLCSLLQERDQQKQRAQEQTKRADDLHVENLRLQVELARYQKWYYGPRADRLRSSGDLLQMLLDFAAETGAPAETTRTMFRHRRSPSTSCGA